MSTRDAGPERLYLLQLGTGMFPFGDEVVPMSFAAYLVQTADGNNVLIDTGLPADFVLPEDIPELTVAPGVVEQLAALGITPDDIDIVVSTHFDVDHAGRHDAFPKADHIVQRKHYEVARSGNPRYDGARKNWDHPSLRYRLIDGDTEILPGLTLIETSGHAPGHQSVLVHLPEMGPVLLAIDAVSLARVNTPERVATPMDDNEEQLRASTSKLRDLAEREKASLVVFGHDGEQWETLTKSPEWYG